MTASAKNSSHNTDKRGKKDRRNHHRKKNHHHQPMASFAEAPAGDVAKGTRYVEFLLTTFLPSFVFFRDSFY